MHKRFRMDGCGPRGGFEFPMGLFAMGMGRGGGWGRAGAATGARTGAAAAAAGTGAGVFDAGELRLVLLKLIADQPRHGYDLIRAIEELTHGSYAPSPGVVYPTLTMLQDMGLIDEVKAEGAAQGLLDHRGGRGAPRRKGDEVEALFERLNDLGSDHRKAGGAPIRRAVGNLLSALWHRVTREDMDEARLHEIAAILDEAAQKIERLK